MLEENWGRYSEIVDLGLSSFNEMLKPMLSGKQVIAAEALTAGRANTNYKLWTEDKAEALVLRLHIRDQDACQKEFNLFKALHTTVPMAEILYVEPSASRFGFPYSVLKWVDGVLLEKIISSQDTEAVTQVAQDVGAKLAAIGGYRFSQPGLINQNLEISVPFISTAASWLSFIERCLFEGHAGQQLGEDLTKRLWQYVNENVEFLRDLPEENALVHADYKGSNILVRQEKSGWRVAAVLDWEFAYAGSPLSDISPLLRNNSQLNPAFEPNFVAGFANNGGKLPPTWKKVVRLLDLLNLCDFLNRPQLNVAMRYDVTQLVIDTLKP